MASDISRYLIYKESISDQILSALHDCIMQLDAIRFLGVIGDKSDELMQDTQIGDFCIETDIRYFDKVAFGKKENSSVI